MSANIGTVNNTRPYPADAYSDNVAKSHEKNLDKNDNIHEQGLSDEKKNKINDLFAEFSELTSKDGAKSQKSLQQQKSLTTQIDLELSKIFPKNVLQSMEGDIDKFVEQFQLAMSTNDSSSKAQLDAFLNNASKEIGDVLLGVEIKEVETDITIINGLESIVKFAIAVVEKISTEIIPKPNNTTPHPPGGGHLGGQSSSSVYSNDYAKYGSDLQGLALPLCLVKIYNKLDVASHNTAMTYKNVISSLTGCESSLNQLQSTLLSLLSSLKAQLAGNKSAAAATPSNVWNYFNNLGLGLVVEGSNGNAQQYPSQFPSTPAVIFPYNSTNPNASGSAQNICTQIFGLIAGGGATSQQMAKYGPTAKYMAQQMSKYMQATPNSYYNTALSSYTSSTGTGPAAFFADLGSGNPAQTTNALNFMNTTANCQSPVGGLYNLCNSILWNGTNATDTTYAPSGSGYSYTGIASSFGVEITVPESLIQASNGAFIPIPGSKGKALITLSGILQMVSTLSPMLHAADIIANGSGGGSDTTGGNFEKDYMEIADHPNIENLQGFLNNVVSSELSTISATLQQETAKANSVLTAVTQFLSVVSLAAEYWIRCVNEG